MQRHSVHTGLLVKLVTDYANVPAGTWATVDSTGNVWNGAWYFTVRWRPYTPIPNKFPRGVTEYSTNLWEADLALFEVLSIGQEDARRRLLEEELIRPPLPRLDGRWQRGRRMRVHPDQLMLFRVDDLQ